MDKIGGRENSSENLSGTGLCMPGGQLLYKVRAIVMYVCTVHTFSVVVVQDWTLPVIPVQVFTAAQRQIIGRVSEEFDGF